MEQKFRKTFFFNARLSQTKFLWKNCPWWIRAQLSPATSLAENSYYVFLGYWGKYLAIVDLCCSQGVPATFKKELAASIGSLLLPKCHSRFQGVSDISRGSLRIPIGTCCSHRVPAASRGSLWLPRSPCCFQLLAVTLCLNIVGWKIILSQSLLITHAKVYFLQVWLKNSRKQKITVENTIEYCKIINF